MIFMKPPRRETSSASGPVIRQPGWKDSFGLCHPDNDQGHHAAKGAPMKQNRKVLAADFL